MCMCVCVYVCVCVCSVCVCVFVCMTKAQEICKQNVFAFFDGCSTVQGLLDWFEVDLGFTELSFQEICKQNVLADLKSATRLHSFRCDSLIHDMTHSYVTRRIHM